LPHPLAGTGKENLREVATSTVPDLLQGWLNE
jgi:hypothetical protein